MRHPRDVPSFMTVTTAPTAEPVSLDEAKAQCAIDSEDFDGQLTLLIQAAREMVEADTDLRLMTQTLTLRLDQFPREIVIPVAPVTAVSSITYVDEAGSTQTLSASVYRTDIYSRPARITLASSQSWPVPDLRPNAVVVTITAGYASAALVPAVAKQAILLLVADWWKNRETMPMPSGSGAADVPGNAIKTTYDNLVRRIKVGQYP
jgi:uncharacterized phiE125 gp8 family phage protein